MLLEPVKTIPLFLFQYLIYGQKKFVCLYFLKLSTDFSDSRISEFCVSRQIYWYPFKIIFLLVNYSFWNFIKTGFRLAISTCEKITFSQCCFNILNQSYAPRISEFSVSRRICRLPFRIFFFISELFILKFYKNRFPVGNFNLR